MFIINGHNIFPRDIETNIKQDIDELKNKTVYAFSVTIDNMERVIVAVEDESIKEREELIKKIKNVVYKYFEIEPYDVIILKNGGLVKTDNGKIALGKNRQAYINGTSNIIYSSKNIIRRNITTGEFTEIGFKIKEIFESVLNMECYSMDDDFFELGGSSLNTVVLIKRLGKEFGINITSEDLIDYSNIKDIEKLINLKKENKNIDLSAKDEIIEETFEEEEERLKRMSKADENIKCNIQIRNVAIYHPERSIDVEEIIEEFKNKGVDIETLVKEQFGKKTLYLADADEENSLTMSIEVVNKVLRSSGLKATDIDMIVSSNTTPEYMIPPMSLIIHETIRARSDASCYDINVNCAGMTFAMTDLFNRMASDKRLNRVLLVGSEFTTAHLQEDNYNMRGAISDGACAIILEKTDRICGLLDSKTNIHN